MDVYYGVEAILEKVKEGKADIIGHIQGSFHPYTGQLLQGTSFESHPGGHPGVLENEVLVGVAYNEAYAVAPDLSGSGRYWEVLENPELPKGTFVWSGAVLVKMGGEIAKKCHSTGNSRLDIENLVTMLEDTGYFTNSTL